MLIKKSSKKTILVTGGAGFLGSHLCERLLYEGHKVICLDNLFTGSKRKIENLFSNNNFTFVNHDIINPVNYEVDEIYNLACPASPSHYQSNPIKTIETSVFGAINVLNLAKKLNCKILQTSTSEVYGDPLEHPQKEEYWGHVNPIGVRSCYDEGKRCAETLFFDYYRTFNIPIKIARVFNTYGPKMSKNDGRVVSNLIVQAIEGKDFSIYGNGEQTRSFCYVSDLIEGLLKLMDSEKNIIGPINLGNPKEFTINELAKTIKEMLPTKSRLRYKDLPSDDPIRRKPDIDKAVKLLNWTPKVDLEYGITKTIEYFKMII